MKSKHLAIAALLLWAATVATFAWFFVHGSTSAGTDGRTAVMLAPAERDLILSEMRGLLNGVHDILQGLNQNDMKQVAESARKVGMGSAADVNPALMAKLPLEFKQLGMSVHHAMDDLALAAEKGTPAAELQQQLTDVLGRCVACHASWQLPAK